MTLDPTRCVLVATTATGHWLDSGDGCVTLLALTPEEREQRRAWLQRIHRAWSNDPWDETRHGDRNPASPHYAEHQWTETSRDIPLDRPLDDVMSHWGSKGWMSKADLAILAELWRKHNRRHETPELAETWGISAEKVT